MNINVSNIVNEWSYRLSLIEDHDGFPDIKSYSDLTVLKSVLSDYKWPVEITYELLYNMEHPESKLITEEPFSYSILGVTKKKYQQQWLDYINNGEEFELEPNGTAIIDKKILQLKGDNSKFTFKELLNNNKIFQYILINIILAFPAFYYVFILGIDFILISSSFSVV